MNEVLRVYVIIGGIILPMWPVVVLYPDETIGRMIWAIEAIEFTFSTMATVAIPLIMLATSSYVLHRASSSGGGL